MKRLMSLILTIALLLMAFGSVQAEPTSDVTMPDYYFLDDADFLNYIDDLVYRETVSSLDSDAYFVEDVSTIYISKEYLEEVAYNSQSNIFFGYTLSDLDATFQGKKYVFTLGEDGTTCVKELQAIEDSTTATILKNVAIGTGVILICVTVSAVSAGVGAPAVSMIFAVSAKTAAICGASSAALGGIAAGIARGIETGDFDEATEAAALTASEGFKWGAVSGAVMGGVGETVSLSLATKGGLTMNEVALIQKESKLPASVISQFRSMEEYEIYKGAGLETMIVNGKTALVQDIDLNYIGADGKTNLQLMLSGNSPVDPLTGKAYELHHVGQSNDSILAILTQEQHRGEGVSKILHVLKESEVDHGSVWQKTVSEFWKYLGNYYVQASAA